MKGWMITAAIPLGYFLIGVFFAMGAAYRAGRRNDTLFDAFDTLFWTMGWPVLCIIAAGVFIGGKYHAFIAKIRQRGYESTLPPKNESLGRPVTVVTSLKELLFQTGADIHLRGGHPALSLEECDQVACQKIVKAIRCNE